MIKESSTEIEMDLQSPSVTICVEVFYSTKMRPIYSPNDTTASSLKKLCEYAENAIDIEECFQRIFYNASEIIHEAKEYEDVGTLSTDILVWPFGKCHTIKSAFISDGSCFSKLRRPVIVQIKTLFAAFEQKAAVTSQELKIVK